MTGNNSICISTQRKRLGFAHVGVLKKQVPIDYITGTSMGAIVAGNARFDAEDIQIDNINYGGLVGMGADTCSEHVQWPLEKPRDCDHAFTLLSGTPFSYSCRSASIGSIIAARRAG